MYFDRLDIIAAYYAYAVDYSDGQWSSLYKLGCRIGKYFHPSPLWRGYDSLSDNGQAIYNRLVIINYTGEKNEQG